MKRRERYPGIRAFVRGYLHQDAQSEYGSAHAALAQYCRDADRQQIERLRAEWTAFAKEHKTLPDINRALLQLGSSWQFQTADEFQQMIAAMQ